MRPPVGVGTLTDSIWTTPLLSLVSIGVGNMQSSERHTARVELILYIVPMDSIPLYFDTFTASVFCIKIVVLLIWPPFAGWFFIAYF